MTGEEKKERATEIAIDNGVCFAIPKGFEDCILGISCSFGSTPRLVLDQLAMIEKLMEDMSEEDAYEYFDFNILGAGFSDCVQPEFLEFFDE